MFCWPIRHGRNALVSMYGTAWIGEQCHRLLAVARHNLLRRMRFDGCHKVGESGLIGIAYEGWIFTSLPDLNRPAIMVVRTLSEFAAHERLRCGDLVLAVDGHQLVENSHPNRLSQEFSVLIGSKQAGKAIRLSIFRDQRILDVILPLAATRALEEMYLRKIGYDLAEPCRGQWMRLQSRLEALGPLRLDLFRRDEATVMESDL